MRVNTKNLSAVLVANTAFDRQFNFLHADVEVYKDEHTIMSACCMTLTHVQLTITPIARGDRKFSVGLIVKTIIVSEAWLAIKRVTF